MVILKKPLFFNIHRYPPFIEPGDNRIVVTSVQIVKPWFLVILVAILCVWSTSYWERKRLIMRFALNKLNTTLAGMLCLLEYPSTVATTIKFLSISVCNMCLHLSLMFIRIKSIPLKLVDGYHQESLAQVPPRLFTVHIRTCRRNNKSMIFTRSLYQKPVWNKIKLRCFRWI